MTLNGIDIASYQRGINLAAVPLDFVFVKATEGVGYVNPDCARAVDQALKAGKLVGVYHYINGAGAIAEADYFFKNCSGWKGKVVFAVDWESGGNKAWGNTAYLDTFIKRLASHTGVPPVLYASISSFPSAVASANNCARWVAQYASMNPTGYQTTPWNEGKYPCTIRQYSSAGRLPGWNGNLDLNKFYGDRNTWLAIQNGGKAAKATPAVAKPAAKAAPKKTAVSETYYWGTNVTKSLQAYFKTPRDGFISSQPAGNKKFYPNVTSGIEWVANPKGSQLVVALQKRLGVKADGLLGQDTAKALQRKLGVAQDGYVGSNTVKALVNAIAKKTL